MVCQYLVKQNYFSRESFARFVTGKDGLVNQLESKFLKLKTGSSTGISLVNIL